jgi:hypothetical protein
MQNNIVGEDKIENLILSARHRLFAGMSTADTFTELAKEHTDVPLFYIHNAVSAAVIFASDSEGQAAE